MRKSGQSAGVRGFSEPEEAESDCGKSRTLRPNRWSHSGPERYVIVAISENHEC